MAVEEDRYSKSILGLACDPTVSIAPYQTRPSSDSESKQQTEYKGCGKGPSEKVIELQNTEPYRVVTISTTSDTGHGKHNTQTKVVKSRDTNKSKANNTESPLRPRVSLPANMEPTFFIGGGNGSALIEEVLTSLGYKRIKEKTDDTFKFKWCELKASINYNTFKEGEQIVNHIPNCQLLTNKLGLLTSLQEYDRVCVTVKRKASRLDFLPETYKLDDKTERQTFFSAFKEGDLWICKPTGRNQGKGIFLVRELEELNRVITENEELNQSLKETGKPEKPLNRIIQRYLNKPLLLNGRKFDIRAYMLIANMCPYLVLYHKGYVRLCMYEYDVEAQNLTAHLTNQFIQKKDPKYKEVKEDTAWSMDQFNDYINEKVAPSQGLEKDWVYNTLTNRMKQIMTFCFNAVKHKLNCKVGYFDLYGLDFMVDENMKVWLIEVNVNPCLATNCEALRDVIPGMVKETICKKNSYIAVECFDKCRRMRPLMPLNAQKNFEILYSAAPRTVIGSRSNAPYKAVSSTTNSTTPKAVTGRPNHRSNTVTPYTGTKGDSTSSNVRRSRSLSPVKEATDSSNSNKSHRHAPKATTLLSPSQLMPESSKEGNIKNEVMPTSSEHKESSKDHTEMTDSAEGVSQSVQQTKLSPETVVKSDTKLSSRPLDTKSRGVAKARYLSKSNDITGPVARSQDKHFNISQYKHLRESTLGAYRPSIIRTITRDVKSNSKSPSTNKKGLSVQTVSVSKIKATSQWQDMNEDSEQTSSGDEYPLNQTQVEPKTGAYNNKVNTPTKDTPKVTLKMTHGSSRKLKSASGVAVKEHKDRGS